MSDIDPAQPSGFLPPRWVIRAAWSIHRALYRWSGGRFGLRSPRADRYGLARLTTIGRRSGQERSVMFGYYLDDDRLVTMAMNGWSSPEPAWWLNLQSHPEATVDLTGGERHRYVAHEAVGEERDRLWQRWREIDDGLDGFAAKRTNETAVVVLERLDGSA
ncbi:MAG: nitroreductase/quinone reductase family protein [Ilumatobacter sp.]